MDAVWIVVGAVAALSWLIFLQKARPLASTLDRAAVMVLKPLSITYNLLTVALAISGAWLVAAVCALASLLNGAIGASLHKSWTPSELSKGTIQHMQKGPRTDLSDADSFLLARVIQRAAMIFGIVLAAVLVHYWLRWYFALPVALVAVWAFMAGSIFLVAYRRKAGAAP